jgi:hypothetical protein
MGFKIIDLAPPSQKRVLAVALISKTVFHESAVDSAFDSLLVFPAGIF